MRQVNPQFNLCKHLIFICLWFLCISTHDLSASIDASLRISQVQLSHHQWQSHSKENVSIRFHINHPAKVDWKWYDSRDLLVRAITTKTEACHCQNRQA